MKTFLITLLLATFLHHPSLAHPIATFTSHHSTTTITSFSGKKQGQKVIMNWTISENQDANLFELERSADGKTFNMAAIVFGTDKTDTDSYGYYEKAKPGKQLYRLKIVHRDQSVSYSAVLTIE